MSTQMSRWLGVSSMSLALGLVAGTTQATIISQNFDAPGTGYTLEYSLENPGGDTAPQVFTGGPSDNYMQLTRLGQNGTRASFTFDPVVSAGSYNQFSASFDFRVGTYPDKGADGFAMALLNTSAYGTTGSPFNVEWEKAPLTDSFALTVRFFPPASGPDDQPASFVGLYLNGNKLSELDTLLPPLEFNVVGKRAGSEHDYANDPFIGTNVLIDYVSGGANVTVSMTTLGNNTTYTLFDDYFVSGLSAYETRLTFGARTGGLAGYMQYDNINAEFAIPEPASLTLLGAMSALLLRRRKA